MTLTVHLGRPGAAEVHRVAVRAVIRNGDRLLLLRSRHRDVKFPGGGVEADETHHEALEREVREECGAQLAGMGPALLQIHERRRDSVSPDQHFQMTSLYYPVTIDETIGRTRLTESERELQLAAVWLTVDEAIAANAAAEGAALWVRRESIALRLLPRRPDPRVTRL